MDITLYMEDETRADELFALCYSEILRHENLFSVNIEASDISKINASDIQHIAVSQETASLIEKAIWASDITDGAFDITVYPAVKLWGFYSDGYRVPSKEEIAEVQNLIGYKKIRLNENGVSLDKGAGVDLGAIAKGYLGDSLKTLLMENGVESAVIALGGNITLVGDKPDGKQWRVAVKNPFSQDEYACVLSLSGDVSVVTSGAYERYFEIDEVTYHHIIDPKTGYPAQSDLASVTVIGEDGAVCDALSTAAFVMGKEKALAFLSRRAELSYVLIPNDGEMIVSENLNQ